MRRALLLAGGGAAVVSAVIAFGGPRLTGQAAAFVYLLVALVGLHVLSVETGQPSLGHAAFMGAGAYLTAFLRLRLHLDGLSSAVLCAALVGALGWVIARGTARLQPAFVALATWSLGWLLTTAAAAFPRVSGGVAGITLDGPMALPLGLDVTLDERGHLLLGALLLGVAVTLLVAARTSTIGLAWAALRDSAVAAAALGHDTERLRRGALVAAATAAGLAGSLTAQLDGIVDPSRYSPLVSLTLFAAVLVGARAGALGPVAGALVIFGLPRLLVAAGDTLGLPAANGSDLVGALVVVAALLVVARVGPRPRPTGPGLGPATAAWNAIVSQVVGPPPASDVPFGRGGVVLRAAGLRRSFGGVRALDDVTLELRSGEVRGLIGPNGSGKSTLLRCIAGAMATEAGNVALSGVAIDRLAEPARVHAGVVRTFQRTVVLPSLSTLEHALAGMAPGARNASWGQALFRTPRYGAAAGARRAAAREVLAVAGLSDAPERPEALPAGRQRLLQLAAAVATGAKVVMLDEPSAGMRLDELAVLEAAIGSLRARGLSVLLVEHNVGFLARVCDQVTVLDSGRVLLTGTPAEVAADARVREAYLGVSAAPKATPGLRSGRPRRPARRRGRTAKGATAAPAAGARKRQAEGRGEARK